MNYIEKIKALGERAEEMAAVLETEEATKNALVMPFISALGWDVFNPLEVIPEFTADAATKKGEKVDYAIRSDDRVVMLWECKRSSGPLDIKHTAQLFRYFTVTQARIAVLTNGLVYQFFSDLEEPNKMDAKPFFEIDLRTLRENQIRELEGMTKTAFDLESMLAAASDLKYMREVRRFLEAQLDEPTETFIRLCFSEANPSGRFSKSVREQFARISSRVLSQMISDRVNDRLRKALAGEGETLSDSPEVSRPKVPAIESPAVEDSGPADDDDGIVTTEEEREAYLIVRGLVRPVCDVTRVVMRDTKSYCGVLFDDNNRKPICRLHFNRSQKYLGLFDAEKKESRVAIESLDDIYQHVAALTEVVKWYKSGDE